MSYLLSYYEPKFPMPQGVSAGPYRTLGYYEPRFPAPQGASAGPYPRVLFNPGLGTYTPNQAFYRGIVPGNSRTLGQIDPTAINLTDPTTLLAIAGAAFVAWYLFKGGRAVKRGVSGYRSRHAKRSSRRRSGRVQTPYGKYDLDKLYPTD